MTDVSVERRGDSIFITLQRTRALNALSLGMIRAIREGLEQARDASVARVVIRGDTRAFCAGGDVRAVRDAVLAGDVAGSRDFFLEEYRLNYAIATLGKPWIAVVDGVCMGGGLGLSVHGSHRYVSARTVMAMPEMAIGMIPDVGGTYFLSRLPGELGTWMALTGARVDGPAAVALGLATHLVSDDDMERVARGELVTSQPISVSLPDVDRIFAGDDLDAIVARMDDTMRASIAACSPTSMAITLRLLREARARSLRECIVAEYRAVRAVTWSHDFLEGIRAVLVDKTRDARFRPVDPDVVARAFTAPEEGDWTP